MSAAASEWQGQLTYSQDSRDSFPDYHRYRVLLLKKKKRIIIYEGKTIDIKIAYNWKYLLINLNRKLSGAERKKYDIGHLVGSLGRKQQFCFSSFKFCICFTLKCALSVSP